MNHNGKLEKDEAIFSFFAAMNKDPFTYAKEISTSHCKNWKIGVKEELNSMNENRVWKIVDRLKIMSDRSRVNIIDFKWVFKKKQETDRSTRYTKQECSLEVSKTIRCMNQRRLFLIVHAFVISRICVYKEGGWEGEYNSTII